MAKGFAARGGSLGRLMILVAAGAGLCLAGDVTGKWSGTLVLDHGTAPGYLMLEQKGAVVAGTAGPSPQNQRRIEKGTAVADQVTIEARPGPALLRFVLKQDGDKLSGEVFEDGQRIGTATFQRVKD